RGSGALSGCDGRRDRDRSRPSDRGLAPGAGDHRPRAPRSDRQGGEVDAALPGARHRRGSRPGCPRVTKQARRMLALMDRATTSWHIPNVGRAKGRVLRRLLDRHRPTRAIELGSLLGYSAILIAGSMPPRGRLTCIEANPFLAYLVRANAAEAGLARRVKVVVGDAMEVSILRRGSAASGRGAEPM